MCLCLWLFAGGVLAQAAPQPPLERHLKAAYLYRFAGFVTWPGDAFVLPDSPLLIGVAGNDELAAEVAHMVAGRSVNGRALEVRRVLRGDSLAGLHILFIGKLERADLADLLGAARAYPLLTVSDSSEAAALGAMVNFVVVDRRLRFAVALAPVGAARLHISARMLAVARRVEVAS
jgi:hypothetical protein